MATLPTNFYILIYIRPFSYMRIFCLILGVLFSSSAFSQADSVKIHVTVIDGYTKRPLSGVSVINPKSSVTFATDARGAIDESTLRRDTLFLFYPGYKTVRFSVNDSVVRNEYSLHFTLDPLTTGLSQPVIIHAQKSLEQIEEERRKMGLTPKELERPELSFSSPISAIYEMLSGRAHEREKLKEQMKDDEKRKIFRDLLRYYNENDLIDLPEKNFEEFITYCNLPEDFLKYSTDYEITKTIVTQYNKYGRESGLIK